MPENPYRGMMFCADCGGRMTLKRNVRTYKSGTVHVHYKYCCPNSSSYGKSFCKEKNIAKEKVDIAIEKSLHMQMELFFEAQKAMLRLNRTRRAKREQTEYQREVEFLQGALERIKRIASGLYEDFVDGVLNEYDYYSRESSKKQKIAWRRMAKNGEYNAGFTLYGYKKASDNKHKLVIDEEAAPIVKEIFSMKLSGIGTTHIAKCLNDRGVPSPAELGRQRGIRQKWRGNFEKYGWTASTVERILREEKYTGTMVMIKTEIQGIRGRQVKRPVEEWIRKEGTHEAIVSHQTYILAVSMLKEQAAKERRKNGRNIYYCGCCGRAMMNFHYGTLCCRNRRFETESPCKNVAIRKADADMAVLQSVKREAALFLEEDMLR